MRFLGPLALLLTLAASPCLAGPYTPPAAWNPNQGVLTACYDHTGALVDCGGGNTSGSASNASSGVAPTATNVPTVAYSYGFNGATWDQLQVDGSKNLKIVIEGPYGSAAPSAGLSVTLDTTSETHLANIDTQTGGAIPSGTNLIGKVGIDQTTPGTTNEVSVSGQSDPCFAATKLQADFEGTSSNSQVIAATSGKKAYVCSVDLVTSLASNISFIEGTGTNTCTGGSLSADYLNTGTTAANGAAFAANGGVARGDGNGTLFFNNTANQNTCVLLTGSPQVNIHVTYVQK